MKESEFKLGLSTTRLAAGTYTFVAKNVGHVPHAFEIDGPAVEDKRSGVIPPGWMIFWMRRQAQVLRRALEHQVEQALAAGSVVGLALVAFVGVLREGVETALFLFGSFEGANVVVSSIGSAVGLALAAGLGYLFYRGSARLDLRRFFTVTSTLLLVFAAYLLASGLHELGEGGILPESELLLMGAFLLVSVPTLYAFLRPAARKSA